MQGSWRGARQRADGVPAQRAGSRTRACRGSAGQLRRDRSLLPPIMHASAASHEAPMRLPLLLLFAATLAVGAKDARSAVLDKARAELRAM